MPHVLPPEQPPLDKGFEGLSYKFGKCSSTPTAALSMKETKPPTKGPKVTKRPSVVPISNTLTPSPDTIVPTLNPTTGDPTSLLTTTTPTSTPTTLSHNPSFEPTLTTDTPTSSPSTTVPTSAPTIQITTTLEPTANIIATEQWTCPDTFDQTTEIDSTATLSYSIVSSDSAELGSGLF